MDAIDAAATVGVSLATYNLLSQTGSFPAQTADDGTWLDADMVAFDIYVVNLQPCNVWNTPSPIRVVPRDVDRFVPRDRSRYRCSSRWISSHEGRPVIPNDRHGYRHGGSRCRYRPA
jgi:hypothetical protein